MDTAGEAEMWPCRRWSSRTVIGRSTSTLRAINETLGKALTRLQLSMQKKLGVARRPKKPCRRREMGDSEVSEWDSNGATRPQIVYQGC